MLRREFYDSYATCSSRTLLMTTVSRVLFPSSYPSMAARSLSLLVASVACMQAAPTSPVVQTQDGSVQGFMNAEGGGQFLGIPFAAPPLGNLRWVVPQPVTPWAGVRSAVTYPPDCIQFYLGSSRPQSENCLYLNVFVPPGVSSAHLAPVLVFIPSGGESMRGPMRS